MVNFVSPTPRVASIHLSSTMKATTSTASRALPRECFLNLSSSRCDARASSVGPAQVVRPGGCGCDRGANGGRSAPGAFWRELLNRGRWKSWA